MTFWQIAAAIVIFLFFVFGAIGLYIFKTSLEDENEINRARLAKEEEWHNKEEANWRQVDPALQKRIKELEGQCRENQRVIGEIKAELANKNEFLRRWKLKDVYDLYLKGEYTFDEK